MADELHEKLFALTRALPEVEGVTRVPERRIQGLAFFPGGAGVYSRDGSTDRAVPRGRVMVVGQDFDNEANFVAARDVAGRENETGATWGVLLRRLEAAGIDPENVFFTNCYLGLRTGRAKNIRAAPGARDRAYRAHCGTAMVEQLRLVRPKLVLCLGHEVRWFMHELSDSGLEAWKKPQTFSDLDRPRREIGDTGAAVAYGARFGNVEVAVMVALSHPCFPWGANSRSWKGLLGAEAEIGMMRDACEAAGLHERRS